MLPLTSDLCDALEEGARVVPTRFADFGGSPHFAGRIVTLRVDQDNALVRATLSEPGDGRVLVVDGGGSLRCALVGGNLGRLAADNAWAGIIVVGAVRDAAELRATPIGVRALGTCPRRARRTGAGTRDIPLEIDGVTIVPGLWLVADADGIVITETLPA